MAENKNGQILPDINTTKIVNSGLTSLIANTKDAITEIKALDSILTKIGRTSDLTSQQLKQLGMSAYDTASKYGKTASDYLNSVQRMAQSGFHGKSGTAMAEQSLLAQSAGDMDAELADKYILATNAAYQLHSEADKINSVLDGQNNIAIKNTIAMTDMANAMTKSVGIASDYQVKIGDLSAMIGTLGVLTGLDGDEIGNAINTILTNLQDVSSKEITDTLHATGISMTEMANGTQQLREPIEILRELATAFNQLDTDNPLRAEILTNIGQETYAPQLSALLQNMDMYDKMLADYAEGGGSALEASNQSAKNLSGTLNTLSNSWTEFVNSFASSDTLIGGVNLLNNLITGATKLVDVITPLGTIGLGAGLFAGLKNVGRVKRNPSYRICLQ